AGNRNGPAREHAGAAARAGRSRHQALGEHRRQRGPSTAMNVKLPSEEEVQDWLYKRSNWGRWGDDDQRGALNLITPEKRRRAAQLVKSGEAFSLSLPLPVAPGGMFNPRPVQHYFRGRQVAHGYG